MKKSSSSISQSFWKNIKRTMELKDLNLSDVAIGSMVGESTLWSGLYPLRTGKGQVSNPPLTAVALICDYLGVTVDSMILGDDCLSSIPHKSVSFDGFRSLVENSAGTSLTKADLIAALPYLDRDRLGMVAEILSIKLVNERYEKWQFIDSLKEGKEEPPQRLAKVPHLNHTLFRAESGVFDTDKLGRIHSGAAPVFCKVYFWFLVFIIAAMKGMNLQKLATTAGVSYPALYVPMQTFTRDPSLELAWQLSNAIQVSLDYLIYAMQNVQIKFNFPIAHGIVKMNTYHFTFTDVRDTMEKRFELSMYLVRQSESCWRLAEAISSMPALRWKLLSPSFEAINIPLFDPARNKLLKKTFDKMDILYQERK